MAWSRESPHSYGKPGWLPPGGRGNGLDAAAWTPLLDADEDLVDVLLRALLIAEIPAYAAPRPASFRQRPRRPVAWRLWVEVWTHAHAQDVVRRELLCRGRQ
jgi:hypothetical protein